MWFLAFPSPALSCGPELCESLGDALKGRLIWLSWAICGDLLCRQTFVSSNPRGLFWLLERSKEHTVDSRGDSFIMLPNHSWILCHVSGFGRPPSPSTDALMGGIYPCQAVSCSVYRPVPEVPAVSEILWQEINRSLFCSHERSIFSWSWERNQPCSYFIMKQKRPSLEIPTKGQQTYLTGCLWYEHPLVTVKPSEDV